MDYYELLEVHRTASAEVIRASFRALSQKWHPDRNSDHAATARMQALNEAYRTLSDPALRAAYDQARSPSVAAASEQTDDRPIQAEQPEEDLPPEWLVVIGFAISLLVASVNIKSAASSLFHVVVAGSGCMFATLAGKASLKLIRAQRCARHFEQAGDLLATMLLVGAVA
jgi:curved DNA-binding protein CbpA